MNNQKGFTLIEMLVVVAIIGILSTIVVIGVRGAREGARDAKRVSDIRTVAANLELRYPADNWRYPATGSVTGTNYPAEWPRDPLFSTGGNANPYNYAGSDDGQSYVLAACLERPRPSGLAHNSNPGVAITINNTNGKDGCTSCVHNNAVCITP